MASSKSGKRRRLSAEEMSAGLARFVAEQEGVAPEVVKVQDLRRLAGGASRLLWSVDIEIAEGELRPLVLRQDPPGRSVAGAIRLEASLVRAAAAEGVPVPRVDWCCDDASVMGAPFYAMERIDGEAIPRRLLRDERYAEARRVMTEQLGAILARVHRIDPDSPALEGHLPRPPEGVPTAVGDVNRVAEGCRAFAIEPHPVLDLAERWLHAHAPAPRPDGFVHGDYRVGNVMFDEKGTRAVLDWELGHVGDPTEDLGWLCVHAWRFGNDELPVGGIGTREALVAAYEAAGGEKVDRAAMHFWEVFGNFKLALVFITQARAYLDGAHATVELASLGRRTAEVERELLRLIAEEGGP